MDATDLIRRVRQYGLDEVEAHLYYNLSRLGASRAATVAEAAGRKRTDVYRVLDHLVEKGFAQKTLERPARYVPAPVEEALARALEQRRSQNQALQVELQDLAKAWPRPMSEATASRSRFTVHQGQSQVMGLLVRLIETAREEISFAVSSDGLARLDAEALRKALQARAAEGLLVRVLAKHSRNGAQPFAGTPDLRVRYGETPTFYQMMAVDDREIALFVGTGKGISDGGVEETVLWLSSPDLVLAQKTLFDHAWTLALPSAELALPRPRQVQVLRGQWVRGARLREMAQCAQERLDIEAGAQEVGRWLDEGIHDALAGAVQRGVQVQVRSPLDPAIPGATYHRATDVRNLVAVADGLETLLSLGVGSPPLLAPEEEWAIWAVHPDFVARIEAGLAPLPVVRR